MHRIVEPAAVRVSGIARRPVQDVVALGVDVVLARWRFVRRHYFLLTQAPSCIMNRDPRERYAAFSVLPPGFGVHDTSSLFRPRGAHFLAAKPLLALRMKPLAQVTRLMGSVVHAKCCDFLVIASTLSVTSCGCSNGRWRVTHPNVRTHR